MLTLNATNDRIKLAIHDDGTGLSHKGEPGAGRGLGIMQYRARMIGGSLDIQSSHDSGTCVTCLFTLLTDAQ
ncbi:MAG: hypothetical protein WD768_05245 [Phycisphaeraceae bacterium]